MFIKSEKRHYVRNNKFTSRTRVVNIYQCDSCNTTYEHREGYPESKHGFTYCSSDCYGKGTVAGTKHRELLDREIMEKYGVTSTLSIPEVREKIKVTCNELYGGNSPFSDPNVIAKIKRTSLERFGVENVLSSPIVRQRVKQTVRERYGVDNIMQIPEVRDKVAKSLMLVAPQALEKRIETNTYRYGVAWPTQLPQTQEKRRETCLIRYGVNHHMKHDLFKWKIDYSLMGKISVENRINGDNPWHSEAEHRFVDSLRDIFGHDDVQHQSLINNWHVDVLIKSLGVYVQFDGVFWHGLTMSIEELENRGYNSILGTMRKDAKQDDWFVSNNVPLVRVTDEYVEQHGIECVIKALHDVQSGMVSKLGIICDTPTTHKS